MLSRQLTAIEDKIIQNKVKTTQDAINYPRKFMNHVGRVYSVHIYNQGPPTGGVLERWADVQAEYAAIRKELKAALAKVEEFNQLLKKKGVAHIIVPYIEQQTPMRVVATICCGGTSGASASQSSGLSRGSP